MTNANVTSHRQSTCVCIDETGLLIELAHTYVRSRSFTVWQRMEDFPIHQYLEGVVRNTVNDNG